MPTINVSKEEFEKLQRQHYKFLPGDVVVYNDYLPKLIGKVYCNYTSDEWNHPATPHVRYVVQWELKNGEAWYNLDDVCEAELMRYREGV